MSINRSIKKVNEHIKTIMDNGFNFRFATIDSYAFIKGKDVRVNDNLPLEAKIFMAIHEFKHLTNNNFKPTEEIIFNFSEVVEEEDYETIKELKKLDFNFDKLRGLFFFDKIFKDDKARLLIDDEK